MDREQIMVRVIQYAVQQRRAIQGDDASRPLVRFRDTALKAKTDDGFRGLLMDFLATTPTARTSSTNPELVGTYTDKDGVEHQGWEAVLDLLREDWSKARDLAMLGLISV